jgi:hypothetical protein
MNSLVLAQQACIRSLKQFARLIVEVKALNEIIFTDRKKPQ